MRKFFAAASIAVLMTGHAVAMTTEIGQPTQVGMLEINGSPGERPGPFDWLTGSTSVTLTGLTGRLEKLASDGDVDALVIRLKDATLTTSQIEELGVAIKAVRDSGIKVHLFAENYGPAEIIMGSHLDEAIIQKGGSVSLPGLYMEEMFLADTLNWIGVKAQMVQVGDYKGANEQFMNSEPSKAWDDNINQLLDSMYANMRGPILEGRGMSERELDRAMEQTWFADADTGIRTGLIDAQVDLAELESHLSGLYDTDIAWSEIKVDGPSGSLDTSNPFALLSLLTKKPDHSPKRSTIAVVHIEGPIMDGDSSSGGLFGGTSTGSRTIRNALEAILNEDRIGGVVVRINSPGGSAIASEVIWQGLKRVGEKKPVYISVGNMAASGGYYIAVGGDRIYTNKNSILGSIGVVGGKFSLGGVYEKLNIGVTPRARGPHAAMFGSADAWTPAQERLVRQRMTETYDLFVSRVSEGRPQMNISRTAEGRLFTGDRAVELKMADRIGGIDTAIGDLASSLGWSEGAYDTMHYPGPQSLEQLLEGTFGMISAPGGIKSHLTGGVIKAEMAALLRELVGEASWPSVSSQLEALGQLRTEPVLLVSPSALIAR